MREKILGLIAWVFYRCLSWTWRITRIEPPLFQHHMKNREPMVLAHWHGHELVLLSMIGKYRITTLTSTSKDGEIMNLVVHLMGAKTVRGSSTRGAVSGMLGLVRALRSDKRNCSFAVDGPKGPVHVAKPGVFEMSRLLKGAPIFPGGVDCSRAWRFPKSWNQTFLPKPFARVVIYWGEPLTIPEDIDPRSDELRAQLENALHNSTSEARKKIAGAH